jgi:hypothetical protein
MPGGVGEVFSGQIGGVWSGTVWKSIRPPGPSAVAQALLEKLTCPPVMSAWKAASSGASGQLTATELSLMEPDNDVPLRRDNDQVTGVLAGPPWR